MNKEYWNNFYKTTKAPDKRSGFADFTLNYIIDKKHIKTLTDIGCGNGRDSIFFSNMGYDVTAIDLNLPNDIDNSKISFIKGDFIEIKNKSDVYYSRFFIHAINETQFNNLLNNLFKIMDDGSFLFIETRGIEGHKNELVSFTSSIGTEHERMLYSMDYIIKKFEENEFKVVYKDQGKGLAEYNGEDPLIQRFILKK